MINYSKQHVKYWLETYGCQMNTAESYALEQALQQAGLTEADSPEEADCAILNTCSVRKTAENRIWGRIGFFQHIKQSRPMTLVVTGCMAQRLGDDLRREAPAVDHVFGTNDKQAIAALLSGQPVVHEQSYSFTESYYKTGEVRAYVPIMNGCNNYCSYCIVPYVRGREVSRNVDSILDEVVRLEDRGVREITLLGQNVNSYRFEQRGTVVNFPSLLLKIVERISSVRWIRFDSPHPKDFSTDLIDALSTSDRIARHVHLPMQSGSSSVLQRMNRHYSREQYLGLIEALRKTVSGITFSTDVMVGFPGESNDEYEDTLSVMREVRFLEAFMYYFNPREGTTAVKFDGQLPLQEKIGRLQRLIEMQRDITAEEKKKRKGSVVELLVEQPSRRNALQFLGRTEHDETAVFTPSTAVAPGKLVLVRLIDVQGSTFKAEEIDG